MKIHLFQPISKKTDQIQGKHTKRRLSKYELILLAEELKQNKKFSR